MTGPQIIDELSLRNRAYNLLYALGESPATVRTLAPGEAERLITLATEAYVGLGDTYFHRLIAARVPVNQLRYVATGRIQP